MENGAIIQLQQEVERLKEQVAVLERLFDNEELLAAHRLRNGGINNEQLKIWSERQIIPPNIAEVQEERPW